jgi:hypothetical protein
VSLSKLVPLYLIALVCLTLQAVDPARAEFTIEGDLETLTVDATNASRDAIVVTISTQFDLEIINGIYDGSTVTGRFQGSLNEVLQAVMGGNGFAIAYEGSRPSRVTFATGQASSTYAARDKTIDPKKDLGKPDEKSVVAGTQAKLPDDGLSRAEATQQAVRELEALLKAARSDIGDR